MNHYFNFSSDWKYYDNIDIASDNEGFKDALRIELQNARPVLFCYYAPNWENGHAVVIDGYENDNFFHFSCGWGGYGDAYFYLFDLDNDNIHNQTAYHAYYLAALGIKPNCPDNNDLTIQNLTIQITEKKEYNAKGIIDLDNVTILGNGIAGGRLTVSGYEINLNAGFEIQPGGTLFIQPSNCNQP